MCVFFVCSVFPMCRRLLIVLSQQRSVLCGDVCEGRLCVLSVRVYTKCFVYVFVCKSVSGAVLCKFSSVRKIDATGLNTLKFF